MTRLCLIYCAKNIVTGQVYIGQVAMDRYIKRIREHCRYSYQQHRREYRVKFHAAIREHGWSSFRWSILYSGVPEEFVDAVEALTIAEYNSVENGLNAHSGGRTVNQKNQNIDPAALKEMLEKWKYKD